MGFVAPMPVTVQPSEFPSRWLQPASLKKLQPNSPASATPPCSKAGPGPAGPGRIRVSLTSQVGAVTHVTGRLTVGRSVSAHGLHTAQGPAVNSPTPASVRAGPGMADHRCPGGPRARATGEAVTTSAVCSGTDDPTEAVARCGPAAHRVAKLNAMILYSCIASKRRCDCCIAAAALRAAALRLLPAAGHCDCCIAAAALRLRHCSLRRRQGDRREGPGPPAPHNPLAAGPTPWDLSCTGSALARGTRISRVEMLKQCPPISCILTNFRIRVFAA